MKNFKNKISKLHYDKSAKSWIIKPLEFCSIFYAVASGLKNKLYAANILKPEKVEAFVISVGNLTTGGVGKTPVVAKLAEHFVGAGEKVAIISRGYGGKLSNKNVNVISDGENVLYNAKDAGDEPFWLAENVKGAYVLTCKNRVKAAKFAIENFEVKKIILDDGFQHRKIHRDLNIVLVDSEMGFGNEKLLPAGPLREGFEAFERIDKLVVVSKNTDHARAEKYAKIMGKKLKLATSVCKLEPDFAYNIKTFEHLAQGETVSAMCAIGQPEQFFNFARSLFNVVKTVEFNDHYDYRPEDIAKISGNILTTEKDAVKLAKFNFDNIFALKLKAELAVDEILND